MKKKAERKKKQQKEGKMRTLFDFHLVEEAFAELATSLNCSSATVGLEFRIRSGLLVQSLLYDVDMKAVKHHG